MSESGAFQVLRSSAGSPEVVAAEGQSRGAQHVVGGIAVQGQLAALELEAADEKAVAFADRQATLHEHLDLLGDRLLHRFGIHLGGFAPELCERRDESDVDPQPGFGLEVVLRVETGEVTLAGVAHAPLELERAILRPRPQLRQLELR